MKCDKCGSTNVQKNYKNCSRCHELKNSYDREYYNKNRDKLKAKVRKRYHANSTIEKEKRRGYYRNHRDDWRKRLFRRDVPWLIDAIKFAGCCRICGFSDKRALVFHHRDGRKKKFGINISNAIEKSWSELFSELLKCDLLCSNCHLIVHDGSWRPKREKS